MVDSWVLYFSSYKNNGNKHLSVWKEEDRFCRLFYVLCQAKDAFYRISKTPVTYSVYLRLIFKTNQAMTTKTFIRLMFLLMIVTSCLLLFAASEKKTAAQTEECPAAKERMDEKQVQGDMVIWESISQHLLSTIQ
jgi:hypothetical protein